MRSRYQEFIVSYYGDAWNEFMEFLRWFIINAFTYWVYPFTLILFGVEDGVPEKW